MAEFPRGFPADCERHALDVRRDLDLDAEGRLDPHALARHLAIPVHSMEELEPHCADSVDQLRNRDRGCFSALTLFSGTKRLIIYNPAHAPGRQANSIAHEFGHVLLEHPPAPVRDSDGHRHWSGMHEREADLMAATLLVPRPGILPVMYRLGGDLDAAARHFGVSRQLMSWRFKKTGAERQMQRAAGRRGQ
jgi:Zn-dependent peptidase ImmA (M78 family)